MYIAISVLHNESVPTIISLLALQLPYSFVTSSTVDLDIPCHQLLILTPLNLAKVAVFKWMLKAGQYLASVADTRRSKRTRRLNWNGSSKLKDVEIKQHRIVRRKADSTFKCKQLQ